MKFSDFVPARNLANRIGTKALLYGPPGTGKTPMISALENSLTGYVENGLSSVSSSTNLSVMLENKKQCDEFLIFLCSDAKELRQYTTYVVDSLTHMAIMILEHCKTQTTHGQKAYGDMGDYIMGAIYTLCALPKNIIFTAQMDTQQIVIPGQPSYVKEKQTYSYDRPLFPGKRLDKAIPHNIDEIWYVGRNIPYGNGTAGPAIVTTDDGTKMARSRCGKLSPLEPTDLNYLINKVNS